MKSTNLQTTYDHFQPDIQNRLGIDIQVSSWLSDSSSSAASSASLSSWWCVRCHWPLLVRRSHPKRTAPAGYGKKHLDESTLQEINISYLGKRKIIFKMPFLGDMLVPWRVSTWTEKWTKSYGTTLVFYLKDTHLIINFSLEQGAHIPRCVCSVLE